MTSQSFLVSLMVIKHNTCVCINEGFSFLNHNFLAQLQSRRETKCEGSVIAHHNISGIKEKLMNTFVWCWLWCIICCSAEQTSTDGQLGVALFVKTWSFTQKSWTMFACDDTSLKLNQNRAKGDFDRDSFTKNVLLHLPPVCVCERERESSARWMPPLSASLPSSLLLLSPSSHTPSASSFFLLPLL